MAELDGPRWGPSRGAARQLVVLCHGVGADGHDLIDLATVWAPAVPGATFVAPDAPERYDMAPAGMAMGRQWFSLADRAPPRMAAGVAAASTALSAFIDAELARLALPPEAYALMGFSQGAMTVLHTGLRRVHPPAAILAFSGALIVESGFTAKPPVLLVHGERDEVVPIERGRTAERVLRAAMVPVQAVWSPTLGHGIDDIGLSAGALFLQRAFAVA